MEITICIDTDKSHTLKAPCNETISSCSVIVNFQRHPVTLLLSSSEKIPEKGSEVWRQVSALALLLPSMCRTLGKSLDTHSRISGCPPENSRHLTQPRHTKEHSNPLATHQSTALYLEKKKPASVLYMIWGVLGLWPNTVEYNCILLEKWNEPKKWKLVPLEPRTF